MFSHGISFIFYNVPDAILSFDSVYAGSPVINCYRNVNRQVLPILHLGRNHRNKRRNETKEGIYTCSYTGGHLIPPLVMAILLTDYIGLKYVGIKCTCTSTAAGVDNHH